APDVDPPRRRGHDPHVPRGRRRGLAPPPLNAVHDVVANNPSSSYTTLAAAIEVTSAWSYAGVTSTTSAATRWSPASARRVASSSRLVIPPASGVPVPGA